MTILRTVSLIGLVTCIGLGASCRIRPRVATMEPRFKQGEVDYIADSRISVPSSFQRVFRVDYMNRGKTADGILKVQLKVMNRTKTRQILMHRFQWTDMNGMVVDTPTSRWITAHLEPGEMTVISGLAPNSSVADFIVSMKQHRTRR